MFAGVLGIGAVAVACDLLSPALGDFISEQGATPVRHRMLSVKMDAAQLSALNPLLVMIVIPVLNLLVYAAAPCRAGIEIRPLQKMTAGMFLAAAAFAAAAVLQEAIQAAGNGVIHGLWQIIPYFIMTVAEVLVSITGLEFAYTQVPRR